MESKMIACYQFLLHNEYSSITNPIIEIPLGIDQFLSKHFGVNTYPRSKWNHQKCITTQHSIKLILNVLPLPHLIFTSCFGTYRKTTLKGRRKL